MPAMTISPRRTLDPKGSTMESKMIPEIAAVTNLSSQGLILEVAFWISRPLKGP